MTTAARIDELRKKFDENPRRYFAPLANELRKAGELSQAIALCREHLPKQPGHMSGYIVFGQALFESGELGEARSVFEQALALDPENLIALRHLGDIARRQGDAGLARRWYERVLDADPRNDDIAAQLATLATPAVPMQAVAALRSEVPSTASMPTPAYAVPPIMLGSLPTPDAAMRAVDIGAIPLRPPEPPPLLDLDAIEAVGESTAAAPEAAIDAPDDSVVASAPVVVETESAASLEVPQAALEIGAPDDAGGETASADVLEVTREVQPAAWSRALEDDPFAFAAESPGGAPVTEDDGVLDVEAAFEEGLAAPAWPDTAALAARIGTPRSVTPVAVDIPPEAVEAFGREPHDAVEAFGREQHDAVVVPDELDAELAPEAASAPEAIEAIEAIEATESRVVGVPETDAVVVDESFAHVAARQTVADLAADSLTEVDKAPFAEMEDGAGGDALAFAEAETVSPAEAQAETEAPRDVELPPASEPEFSSTFEDSDASVVDVPVAEAAAVSEPEMFSAADELDDMVAAVAADDDLPWLAAASGENDAVDEVTAIAEALEADARSSGEPDDVAVLDKSEAGAGPIEASFADVMPTMDADDHDSFRGEMTSPETSPAFVTETMGELLVAQGLTAKAVSVYEELVHRRPYDPVLSSRLAELREMIAPAPVVSVTPVPPVFTARERFALLASRRAPRRTPALASRTVDAATDDSLSALFGTEPMPHDESAARSLAAAFAPVPEVPGDAGPTSLFSATPSAGTVRQRTPLRPMTPLRAATPIASEAVGATGDFSFDRFFPDPATAGRPAVDASGSIGGPESPSAGASSASEDLSQFSAWLKGLGNT